MGRRESYQFPFASYPSVRIVLLLIAGILFSNRVDVDITLLLGVCLSTLLLWTLFEITGSRTSSPGFLRTAALCYLALIFLSGSLLNSARLWSTDRSVNAASVLELYEWDEVQISGRIIESGRTGGGRTSLLVSVNETILPEGSRWLKHYRVRLYGGEEMVAQAGDRIEADIRPYTFPERRNPHDFDYGSWLKQRGVGAHGELVRMIDSERSGFQVWNPMRSAVNNQINQLFSEKHAPMARALFLGYKEDLDPETRTNFSRSGLSHVMAVSGLHVGFIVAPFWLIIPWFWGKRWGKAAGITMLTLLLLGYAGLTGFSASVCRASLMAWFLAASKLCHKVRNPINLTAAAAAILLIIDPGQIYEVGFQLSFGAVLTIFLVMPAVQRWTQKRGIRGPVSALLSVVMISVVVQAGLYPILINTFGEFSVIGPLANALVVPLLSMTVPVGLAITLLTMAGVEALSVLTFPVEWSLGWIMWVADTLGSRHSSYLTSEGSGKAIYLVWLAILLVVPAWRVKELRWKAVIFLLLAVNISLAENWFTRERFAVMTVTVLDVGQGDAIHIRTPNGKHLLVDAGRWSPAGNSGEQVLIPYFRSKGVERIDALILSHPHADHIGGVPSLIREMEIGAIYQSDYDYGSRIYGEMIKLADQKEIPVKTPFAGDMITTDPDIAIFVVGPEPVARRPSNPNDHSLAVKIQYGRSSILLTGDAERRQERMMADSYGDFLRSDLYKAGHHGSNTSSTPVFMQLVEPDVTIASLALRNRFGHPGRDAVDTIYHFSGKKIYTSLEGAVQYESDGRSFNRVYW